MSHSDIEQRQIAQPGEGASQGPVRTYTRWQLFFLDRVERLAELNRQAERGELDELEFKVLRRATFSTLLDCDVVSVGDEARRMLSPAPLDA